MQRNNRVLSDSRCQKLSSDMQRCFSAKHYDQSKCLDEIQDWEDCVQHSDREHDYPNDYAPTPITPISIIDPRTPTV